MEILVIAVFVSILIPWLIGGQFGAMLLMKKPKVPEFKKISPQKEQEKALAGNIAAMPKVSELARQIASMSAETREMLFPGAKKTGEMALEEIQSALRGELPKDVQSLIAQRAAERGVALGTTGSQFAQFGELRDIGMTSLERINMGIGAATKWLEMANVGVQLGAEVAGQMMITPQFQAAFSAEERNAQFQRDWVANQVKAAFDKMTLLGQSMLIEDAQITQLASSFLSSYAGSKMGSDRNTKTDIKPGTVPDILDKIAGLPIWNWRYKSDPSSIVHLGPMAQDFYNQFHLGGDPLKIDTVDAFGIALMAIKELTETVSALQVRIEELEEQGITP